MPAKHPSASELPVWARLRPDGQAIVLTLHVQPNARASGPAGRHGDALKLRIAAPATENRANEALLDYLHEKLDLPRSRLRILHGASSRHKVIELATATGQTAARLRAWDDAKT